MQASPSGDGTLLQVALEGVTRGLRGLQGVTNEKHHTILLKGGGEGGLEELPEFLGLVHDGHCGKGQGGERGSFPKQIGSIGATSHDANLGVLSALVPLLIRADEGVGGEAVAFGWESDDTRPDIWPVYGELIQHVQGCIQGAVAFGNPEDWDVQKGVDDQL